MQDLSNEAAMELDALNEIPSGVGIFDLKDSVIEMKFLNDGFYRMIGARREDRARFFSKGTINSVHPDDRPGLLKEAGDSIAEKRRFEYRFRNLNGAGEYMPVMDGYEAARQIRRLPREDAESVPIIAMLKVLSSRSPANLNLRLAYPLKPGAQNSTLKMRLSD